MTTVSVRRASAGDGRRISLAAQATFLETFAGLLDGDDIVAHCECEHGVAAYTVWLADPAARIWLAETDEGQAPVGYLLMAPVTLPLDDVRDDDLEVKRIYLLRRFHGSGVGQALMERAIAEGRALGARRLLLGVYAGNERAIAFYSKNGFSKVGDRRFQVGSNSYEDVMLARDLTAH